MLQNNDRYSRQVLFDPIGHQGQDRLGKSAAVIIGCGALGGIHIEALARAGLGRLKLVDRDFVEQSNLQRQLMFEESDAQQRLPKAVAAARRVNRINSSIDVEPVVVDAGSDNIEDLIQGADVILDGTDNFEIRFLINDAAMKAGIPWIYGAAVGSYGLTMTVVPGAGPCLRCVLEEMPPPGSGPTCDTAGVIAPIIGVIGSIQSAEAMKILVGDAAALHRSLIRVDLWDFQYNRIDLSGRGPGQDCHACRGNYEYLRGMGRPAATTLCGRNAVQVTSARLGGIDFGELARRLEPLGDVSFNEYLLRFHIEGYDITVFQDARSIIRGTGDVATARTLYARYIGA
ncbi:MAG TPA: ThiF family adenylyltransferase [Blastocatellia bacterium]|nr:ThiF family adenylyltransferase [Blastocatellia bacterium]